MSDVRVVCPECDGTFSYPSRTTVTKLTCPDCGARLTAASIGELLRRRRMNKTTQPVSLRLAGGGALAAARMVEEPPPMAPPMDTILQQREERRRKRQTLASDLTGQVWLIGVAAAMLSFQSAAADLREYLPVYVWTRNLLLIAVCGWLVVDAWRASIWHGLACMVFPPYLLLYAISQVESVILRGLVFSLMIGLVGEAWMLPGDSLVLRLGPTCSAVVDQVNQWLDAAARAPI